MHSTDKTYPLTIFKFQLDEFKPSRRPSAGWRPLETVFTNAMTTTATGNLACSEARSVWSALTSVKNSLINAAVLKDSLRLRPGAKRSAWRRYSDSDLQWPRGGRVDHSWFGDLTILIALIPLLARSSHPAAAAVLQAKTSTGFYHDLYRPAPVPLRRSLASRLRPKRERYTQN
ncbi:hypothetical protein EVAR_79040_1 [Eumeta japonica]|uniref:Uncharacterized protein n=1 Tax=Eumeta variegata TaxID=151549 RepID=A0A4C1XX12_EUMVA|nr:hypothetical protein EVAR_79040_1 [Eumeta japonica]